VFRSETLSISIDCPLSQVYDFLLEPLNIPIWGSNLGGTIRHAGGSDWITETPDGPLTFRIPGRNAFGVLDHAVFRPGETPELTPMRVFANDGGTELTYTMYQRPGATNAQFASEVEWVRADFLALKSLLESGRKR
jgi:hypothetical protein